MNEKLKVGERVTYHYAHRRPELGTVQDGPKGLYVQLDSGEKIPYARRLHRIGAVVRGEQDPFYPLGVLDHLKRLK